MIDNLFTARMIGHLTEAWQSLEKAGSSAAQGKDEMTFREIKTIQDKIEEVWNKFLPKHKQSQKTFITGMFVAFLQKHWQNYVDDINNDNSGYSLLGNGCGSSLLDFPTIRMEQTQKTQDDKNMWYYKGTSQRVYQPLIFLTL